MSINVTVHSNPQCAALKNNFLVDEEHLKKQLFEERRKLRLEQVRQKSKELASKVRQNVILETEKQLKRIEQIKADELRKWREKAMRDANEEYRENLLSLGDAHKAAALETIRENKLKESKQAKIDKSLKNKRKQKETVNKTNKKSNSEKGNKKANTPRKPKPSCHEVEMNDENSSNLANMQSNLIGTSTNFHHIFPHVEVHHAEQSLSETSESSEDESDTKMNTVSTDKKQNKNSYANYKKKFGLSKTPPIVLNIDSESDSFSIADVEDNYKEINTQYSRISSSKKNDSNKKQNNETLTTLQSTYIPNYKPADQRNVQPTTAPLYQNNLPYARKPFKDSEVRTTTTTVSQVPYDPQDYKSMETSSETSEINEAGKLRFTEISEFIKNRQKTNETSPIREKTKCSTDLNRSTYVIQRQVTPEKSENVGNNASDFTDKTKSIKTTPIKKKVQIDRTALKPSPKKVTRPGNLKTSTKSTSTLSQSNRVQFYDYNNKFQKQYQQPEMIVVRNDEESDKKTAMEQAGIELQLKEAHQRQMDELKQRSDERSQKALEREQIKRDYEELTAKLDALNKEKNLNRGICDDVNSYSENRIRQFATERQKKMNTAVENVLQRPVVITCPEIKNPSTTHLNVGSNVKLNSDESDFVFNSSDSCASILLNYVDRQTKQISDDIGNCDNKSKIENLKTLLNKINNLRLQLLNELKKCDQELNNDNRIENGIKNVVSSITSLRKEREEILSDNNYEKSKTDLEKREKILKKKEEILEKKIREIYEEKKNKNQEKKSDKSIPTIKENDEEDLVILSETTKANKPVKIIIQLDNQMMKNTIKSPFKSPRKRSSLIDIQPKRKKKITNVTEKLTKETKPSIGKQTISESTTSTAYRSPPDIIHTQFGQLLNEQIEKSEQSKKPTNIIENPIKKTQNKQTQLTKKQINPLLGHYIERLLGMSRNSIDMLGVSSSEVLTPSSSIINTSKNFSTISENDFVHNQEQIDRLKKFIDDNYNFLTDIEKSLSISDGDGDSSVKTIENIWMKTLKQNEMKMKEEKQQKEQQKQKELRSILKKKKDIIKKHKSQQAPSPTEQKLLDTQRKDSIETSNNISKISSPNDSGKLELVNKYTELTENCTQRIAELNDMINKVREEKQRILEITLSTSTETQSVRNSTEYMDFPDRHQHGTGSSNNSSKISDAKILTSVEETSEKIQLEKNKLTGISRDSGISLSRPLTALDTRDSPDIRLYDKSTIKQSEGIETINYEPILKDIPKIPIQLQSPITLQIPELLTNDIDRNKRDKPPVSMSRYSPQLVEEIPHELSTILEVETPATSRINTSVNDNKQDEKYLYKRFPTFEEYAKQHNLDLTRFDPEQCSRVNYDLQELLNITNKGNLNYEEFPSINTYLTKINNDNTDKSITQTSTTTVSSSSTSSILSNEDLQELINSLKTIKFNYKQFPTHKDYADNINISGLLNTQSIDNVINNESLDKENKDTNSTSSGSLVDIVAELKRRNILKHSFRNEIEGKLNENNNKTNDSKISTDNSENLTSYTPINPINNNKSNLESPKKPSQAISRLQFKTPNKNNDDEMKIVIKTPVKNKITKDEHFKSRKENVPEKTDETTITGIEFLQYSSNQSSLEAFEKDLDRMGMKWASLMLKKSQNTKDFSSSTSSGFVYQKTPRKKPISPKKTIDKSFDKNTDNIKREILETDSSSSLEANGKPINLRDFLARELQKRTNTSSSLSTDDSLASQFLKSLLGTNNSTPKQSFAENKKDIKDGGSNNGERQRTSTPVLTRSTTSSTKPQNHDNSSKLFSGESRLSSIKISSSSGSHSDMGNPVGSQQQSTFDDILIAPDLRLDSARFLSSSFSNKKSSS